MLRPAGSASASVVNALFVRSELSPSVLPLATPTRLMRIVGKKRSPTAATVSAVRQLNGAVDDGTD